MKLTIKPNVPISPKNNINVSDPIIVSQRWIVTGGQLTKNYNFLNLKSRNVFLQQLFDQESKRQHSARILVDGDNVTINISTKNVGVTDLDKEYAKWCDITFKELFYNTYND